MPYLNAFAGQVSSPPRLPSLKQKIAGKMLEMLGALDAREFPIGFGMTPVNPGANVIISAAPQVNVEPVRLVIPSTIAQSFTVNDVRFGMRSQLISPGAIPAAVFVESAIGRALALDTLFIGQMVMLDVTNIVEVPRRREVLRPETPTFKRLKKETKKSFEARKAWTKSANTDAYKRQVDTAEREYMDAMAANARIFTAALFCKQTDDDPHDGCWHARQLARHILSSLGK